MKQSLLKSDTSRKDGSEKLVVFAIDVGRGIEPLALPVICYEKRREPMPIGEKVTLLPVVRLRDGRTLVLDGVDHEFVRADAREVAAARLRVEDEALRLRADLRAQEDAIRSREVGRRE
jgi:hypothetical protein